MLLGCCFYAIFVVLLFLPPRKATPIQISVWYGAFYVLFFIADSVVSIPYYALGPELSTDSKEREKMYVLFYILQYLGVLFACSSPLLLHNFLKNCDCNYCEADPIVLDIPECINKCKMMCDMNSNANSLLYISTFLGIIFIISIILLSSTIKEKRRNTSESDKTHFIPSIYRVFDNKPFIKLLIPWMIDVTLPTIISTLLPFFINYVVSPQKNCIKRGIDLSHDECSPTVWLGYTITSFFICVIISMIFWHYVVSKYDKKKIWQLYSIINIFTFSLFLLCGEGSTIMLVVVSGLNAFPAGCCYLNDVFLSEIIDYDEFTVGKRNEGLYMVFSTFTPKIVSVFAQSIPLSIMDWLGFIKSSEGEFYEQPSEVVNFIKFYFIAIPVCLSLLSYYFKMDYPMDADKKINNLRNTILCQRNRILSLNPDIDFYKIKNPIYGNTHIFIVSNKKQHQDSKLVAEHFNDMHNLKLLSKQDYETIRKSMVFRIVFYLTMFVFFIMALIITFQYLEVKSLSLIPILSLFFLTFSLFFLIINITKLNVINKVIDGTYKLDSDYIFLMIYRLKHYSKQEQLLNTQLSSSLKQTIE